MRSAATLLLSLAMASAAFVLAIGAPGGEPQFTRADLVAATGAVHITNSREGQALLSAAGMRPGGGVSGTVRIGNDGTAPGRFSVRAGGVQDSPGPGGQRLSASVRLVLFDITDVRAPVTVYAGPPAALGDVGVGTLAPGQYRDFLFSVTLPGTADNRLQGAGMSLGFEWRATPAPVATPTPTPTPKPKPKPTPTPVPTPTAPPVVTADALADALGLPPSRLCVARAGLRFRLKAPSARLVSAKVAINGKVKARVRGATKTRVTLRRLPKRRFKVTVAARTSDGKVYTATRTYRACKARR
jgi:hypothetical protein